ncbi:UNVERIFIED_CONTAM: hypothetical protein FKN15_067292 [Acipenser sinensis]
MYGGRSPKKGSCWPGRRGERSGDQLPQPHFRGRIECGGSPGRASPWEDWVSLPPPPAEGEYLLVPPSSPWEDWVSLPPPPAEGEFLLVPPPPPWEDNVSLPPPPAEGACLLVSPLQPEGEEALPPWPPEGEEALLPWPPEGEEALPPWPPEGEEALPPWPPEGEEALPPWPPEGEEALPPWPPEGEEALPPWPPEGEEALPPLQPEGEEPLPPKDASLAPPKDANLAPPKDAFYSPQDTGYEGRVELPLPPLWPGAPLPSSPPEGPLLLKRELPAMKNGGVPEIPPWPPPETTCLPLFRDFETEGGGGRWGQVSFAQGGGYVAGRKKSPAV